MIQIFSIHSFPNRIAINAIKSVYRAYAWMKAGSTKFQNIWNDAFSSDSSTTNDVCECIPILWMHAQTTYFHIDQKDWDIQWFHKRFAQCLRSIRSSANKLWHCTLISVNYALDSSGEISTEDQPNRRIFCSNHGNGYVWYLKSIVIVPPR